MPWHTISHQTLIKELIQPSRPFQLVDIRPKEQFDAGHVRGSVHLNCLALRRFAEQAHHHTPVVLICRRGRTSRHAAMWLHQLGFTAVYSLSEGFDALLPHIPEHVERTEAMAL